MISKARLAWRDVPTKIFENYAIMMASVSAGKLVWNAVQRPIVQWKDSKKYYVTISARHMLYHQILHQVSVNHGQEFARTVELYTAERTFYSSFEAQVERMRDLRWFFNGKVSVDANIKGHKITFRLDNDNASAKKRPDGQQMPIGRDLLLVAYSEEGRAALLDYIQEIVDSFVEKDDHGVYILNRWGDWEKSEATIIRTIDKVIIDPKMKQAVIDDLNDFLGSEQKYVDLGLPYHRGYLFHGPPGGGKTSFARALASHFAANIYHISLSGIKEDADFYKIVNDVPARSFLLLEDIDTAHAAVDREESITGGITTSALLNALDGVTTPHGLIVIMTTNYKDRLDDALIRPGRVDVDCEFGVLTEELVESFWRTFIEDSTPPADFMELVGRAPAEASEAVRKLVIEENKTISVN